MNEMLRYDSMKAKGVENYIELLKENNLLESVTNRLEKKNGMPPLQLIEQLFKGNDINFCNVLFSDFYFDYDSFFENFVFNIKNALQIGFQGYLKTFTISYIFYHRTTKEFLGEAKFINGDNNLLEKEINHFNKWMSLSDPIFKIHANVNNQIFEFIWRSFDHCSTFLKEMNNFNIENRMKGNWNPLPSDYSDHYIFTTKEEYETMKSKSLIIPEGYESEKTEYPIQYAKNI